MKDKQSDYKPHLFYILEKHEKVIARLAYMQGSTKSLILRQILDDYINSTKKGV